MANIYLPTIRPKQNTLHAAATVAGNGATIQLDFLYRQAVVYVSGTFVGTLIPVCIYKSGVGGTGVICRDRYGNAVKFITAPGVYYVDVSGAYSFYCALSAIASGSVTVESAYYTMAGQPEKGQRNVLLASVQSQTMAAETATTAVISDIDVRDYLFNYVVARFESAGSGATVSLYYETDEVINSILPETPVIQPATALYSYGDTVRFASDWFEVRGTHVSVNLENAKSTDLVYTIALFGVK
ncbi:MAG: hypothetical protein AB9880_03645 [Christensenellales bacterium]